MCKCSVKSLKMDVFCRFESYDFEADAKFEEGLRCVQNVSGSAAGLLHIKLFYYNRFVEPIDHRTYKQWKSSNGTSDSGCELLPTKESAETEETEAVILTFADVMKLIQEGKEVPGVKTLDVQPTNQNPAPSQMQRILKPWEKSLQSA